MELASNEKNSLDIKGKRMDENNYYYEYDAEMQENTGYYNNDYLEDTYYYDDDDYYEPRYDRNVQGLLSLIFGILSCSLAVICGINLACDIWAISFGAAAIVLGIIGVTRKYRPKGQAKAGLILGIVGSVLACVVYILFFALAISLSVFEVI